VPPSPSLCTVGSRAALEPIWRKSQRTRVEDVQTARRRPLAFLCQFNSLRSRMPFQSHSSTHGLSWRSSAARGAFSSQWNDSRRGCRTSALGREAENRQAPQPGGRGPSSSRRIGKEQSQRTAWYAARPALHRVSSLRPASLTVSVAIGDACGSRGGRHVWDPLGRRCEPCCRPIVAIAELMAEREVVELASQRNDATTA
jgi:hypothetical protein